MRALLVGLLGLAACRDAVTLSIASDRPIPRALDAICVGIADVDAAGGQFGQRYVLEGDLAALPQTLRVEAGAASEAWAWVRADRGGVPVARASVPIDFGDDATLDLATCVRGPGGAPAAAGAPVGPARARLVASQGQGGTIVVAIDAVGATILDARGHALVATPTTLTTGAPVTAAIALDLDGDCDDDVVVAAGGALRIWRRDGAELVDAGTLDAGAVAIAAADVDGDGSFDLVVGGAALTLYLNDGSGAFTRVADAIPASASLTSVTAIAAGDLDGDGHPDLVVGQAGGSLLAWFGAGGGSFVEAIGAVPRIALDVVALALVDTDDDFDPDLVVAVRDAPMRLYVDRGGLLEDQSFVRLPEPAPIAAALAIGGWDDSCEPDAVIVGAAGAYLRGLPTATFEARGDAPPVGSDVVLADVDDDGDLDALVAGPEGVTWLAR